jgi:hypothetical protein
MSSNPALPVGSWVYLNWREFRAGKPELFAEELELFSDSRFVGEVRRELGPYLLLNALPDDHNPGKVASAVVLRLCGHYAEDLDRVNEAFQHGIADTNSFTGGSTYDDVASLIALAYRCRIAVGGVTRSVQFRRSVTYVLGQMCYLCTRSVPRWRLTNTEVDEGFIEL